MKRLHEGALLPDRCTGHLPNSLVMSWSGGTSMLYGLPFAMQTPPKPWELKASRPVRATQARWQW